MQRFWSKVSYGRPGECWEWVGYRNKDGYGIFWFEGRPQIAARVAFQLAKPSMWDATRVVCHSCDNPICVRPGHLFLGTHADNQRDKLRKGRGAVRIGRRMCGDQHWTRRGKL